MMSSSNGSSQTVKDDLLANPYGRIEELIEKKKRNLEKRRMRLKQYDEDERNGKQLSEEQRKARSYIGEVETQLDFMKDLNKILTSSHKQYIRSNKIREKNIRKQSDQNECNHIKQLIYYQNVLRRFDEYFTEKCSSNEIECELEFTEAEREQLQKLREILTPELHSDESLANIAEKNAKVVYKILSDSNESVTDELNGLRAKQLLERIANFDYSKVDESIPRLGTEGKLEEGDEREEEDDLDRTAMEETELVKGEEEDEASAKNEEGNEGTVLVEPMKTLKVDNDPKVVFVQGDDEDYEPSTECLSSSMISTEFGFDSSMVVESDRKQQYAASLRVIDGKQALSQDTSTRQDSVQLPEMDDEGNVEMPANRNESSVVKVETDTKNTQSISIQNISDVGGALQKSGFSQQKTSHSDNPSSDHNKRQLVKCHSSQPVKNVHELLADKHALEGHNLVKSHDPNHSLPHQHRHQHMNRPNRGDGGYRYNVRTNNHAYHQSIIKQTRIKPTNNYGHSSYVHNDSACNVPANAGDSPPSVSPYSNDYNHNASTWYNHRQSDLNRVNSSMQN